MIAKCRARLLGKLLCPMLLLSWLTGPARAEPVTDRDGQHLSGLSGAKGKTHAHQHQAANYGLKGLSFIEAGGDRPCRLVAIYDRLSADHLNLTNHDFPDHGCTKQTESTKTVRFSGRDEFVQGVKVCLNGKGNRIKGAEIHGARVTDSHKVVPFSETRKVVRTNCKDWKALARCAKTEIAVGMQVHYTDADGYRGVELMCRPLQQLDRTR